MANTVTNISKLDFTDIRQELKDYLKNQEEFTDYDFEGSGINALLDVMSYNTHMNAMIAHLSVNEPFLETAQLRSNVVSHAFTLGYVPKSYEASNCLLDIVIQGTETSPTQMILPDGFKFSGRINVKEYIFITTNSYTATRTADNKFIYNNVYVAQGEYKTDRYTVDGVTESQQFIVNSDQADISSIEVVVYDNAATTDGVSYNLFNNIGLVGPDAPAYFVKENRFGKYSIFFGDNNISIKPPSGAIVELTYLETEGKDANGIVVLNPATPITEIDPTVLSVTSRFNGANTYTTGGRFQETTESIRRNAPLYHATQDRAVTANDYRILILNKFTELVDCSVWGGEEADPPVYGKVFIAPAVPQGERLTTSAKSNILSFLKTKNIGAILPEIIESEYAFIKLFLGINYNPNATELSPASMEAAVRAYTTLYNEGSLNRFSSVFRQSNFLTDLNNLDEGIISSIVRTAVYKILSPNPTKPEDYLIKFPCEIYPEPAEKGGSIKSSVFLVEGISMRLRDETIVGDSSRHRLYFVDAVTNNKIGKYADVGYLVPAKGEVYIQNVKFDLANPITLEVRPDAYDIAPIYNQLIYIKAEDVTIEMRLDTIATNGTNGVSSYRTFTRHGD
jgi:hypothetical protein